MNGTVWGVSTSESSRSQLSKAQANRKHRKPRPSTARKGDQNPLLKVFENRQYAASAVGAFLLIAMFAFLVVAIFLGIVKPDIIASAFTLILGYFFGQVASR